MLQGLPLQLCFSDSWRVLQRSTLSTGHLSSRRDTRRTARRQIGKRVLDHSERHDSNEADAHRLENLASAADKVEHRIDIQEQGAASDRTALQPDEPQVEGSAASAAKSGASTSPISATIFCLQCTRRGVQGVVQKAGQDLHSNCSSSGTSHELEVFALQCHGMQCQLLSARIVMQCALEAYVSHKRSQSLSKLETNHINKFGTLPGDIGSADEGEHCEFAQDVILRLETLTVHETKVRPATYVTNISANHMACCPDMQCLVFADVPQHRLQMICASIIVMRKWLHILAHVLGVAQVLSRQAGLFWASR